ncbi:Haloalkane dehalogenase [BD1-7 clade bacterium]|nr:Haloalkane dehalogenase [BD1-7 clade bacterium]
MPTLSPFWLFTCRFLLLFSVTGMLNTISTSAFAASASKPNAIIESADKVKYRTAKVDNHTIFYREAGDKSRPTLVLLHGYPSSSHTYRELIPLLAKHYHVIAPDNLGSGYSDKPDPAKVTYSFDTLAQINTALLKTLGIKKYTLYMQDFGAPVGFRMMQANPQHIEAIIAQNANAYLDGLTPKRQQFFRNAHEDRSAENTQRLMQYSSRDAIINGQYLRDVPAALHDRISPDAWTHDLHFLQTDAQRMIQVQLFQDYYSNLLAYPKWQAFLRKQQYPALIVWGRHDAAFIVPGALGYLRDLPHAELHLLDAGHFAVEEKPQAVAELVLDFMNTLYQHSQP